MGDKRRFPISGTINYGKTSSGEFSRVASRPTRAELDSLFGLLTEYPASFFNLNRLDDPNVVASIGRSIKPSGRGKSWELTRGEAGSGCIHQIACNDRATALDLLIEWATSEDVSRAELGGHEWNRVEVPNQDGLLFEWETQPVEPIDAVPFEQPEFFDAPLLCSLLKTALSSAWDELRSQQHNADISGFGLDTVGDPFLLPTAFLRSDPSWVPAESSVHLVGHEAFDDVTMVIERAMAAFAYWEESLEELDELGQLPQDFDEMQVYQQMCLAIYEAGIRALSELRSEGLFAVAPDVVLNLWHMETEPTLRETLRRCNSPAVADRYLSEVGTR